MAFFSLQNSVFLFFIKKHKSCGWSQKFRFGRCKNGSNFNLNANFKSSLIYFLSKNRPFAELAFLGIFAFSIFIGPSSSPGPSPPFPTSELDPPRIVKRRLAVEATGCLSSQSPSITAGTPVSSHRPQMVFFFNCQLCYRPFAL